MHICISHKDGIDDVLSGDYSIYMKTLEMIIASHSWHTNSLFLVPIDKIHDTPIPIKEKIEKESHVVGKETLDEEKNVELASV